MKKRILILFPQIDGKNEKLIIKTKNACTIDFFIIYTDIIHKGDITYGIKIMSRLKKLIKKWKEKIPVEARRSEVEIVLNHYFPDEWDFAHGGSSHIVIDSEKLDDLDDITRLNLCTIPIKKGGHYVKGRYIKNLIKIVEHIEKEEEQ